MLKSQEMRKLAPEMDPLRIGTGWKKEDLEKPQIMVESTYGDSHPGSGHLNLLVEEVRKGVAEAGGFGARYFELRQGYAGQSDRPCACRYSGGCCAGRNDECGTGDADTGAAWHVQRKI